MKTRHNLTGDQASDLRWLQLYEAAFLQCLREGDTVDAEDWMNNITGVLDAMLEREKACPKHAMEA